MQYLFRRVCGRNLSMAAVSFVDRKFDIFYGPSVGYRSSPVVVCGHNVDSRILMWICDFDVLMGALGAYIDSAKTAE